MVEFALISPVVIIMLFLCIDFARLVYTYAAVSWAAREAARVVDGFLVCLRALPTRR